MASHYHRMRSLFARRAAVPFVPITAPVAYWKLDDSPAAAVGAFVLAGTEGYTAGKYGSAALNATLSTASVPVLAGPLGATSWAVAFWFVKPTVSSSRRPTVQQTNTGGGNDVRLQFSFFSPNATYGIVVGPSAATQQTGSIQGVTAAGFNHAILVNEAGLATLYINGAAFTTLDTSAEVGEFDLTGSLQITTNTAGTIDDVAIWLGDVPSVEEIARIAASAGDLSTLLA